jgi:hypothetical protein
VQDVTTASLPRRRSSWSAAMTRRWLPEPWRIVPRDGGHVTVRVDGYLEGTGTLVQPDGLGRLRVQVAAGDGTLDVLDLDGQVIGHVGGQWLRLLQEDLRRCAHEGVTPVVRASLVGPRGERNMFVMLAWPTHRPTAPRRPELTGRR